MNPDTLISRSDEQISCDLAGEKAILNIQAGVYYGLDGVGGFIWDIIERPTRYADIKSRVLGEYDTSEDVCDRDLKLLLEDLKKKGLVLVYDKTDNA